MNITDELRDWRRTFAPSYKSLDAIADRIDAEHERQTSGEYLRGANDGYDQGFASADDWLAQHEDAMVEHGWVRLPVDADGAPIRIGDAMALQYETKEKPYVVQSFTWDGEDWYFTCDEGLFNVCGWEHHHAQPTVEDVLREFAYGLGVPVADSYVAATAAKLRLAGDE